LELFGKKGPLSEIKGGEPRFRGGMVLETLFAGKEGPGENLPILGEQEGPPHFGQISHEYGGAKNFGGTPHKRGL